jgi:hypothetical protein
VIERALLDLLATLDERQRQRICFPLEATERFDWHYIPKERAGLALKEMGEASRAAAMALLQAALSEKGYARSRAIMQLEELVAEIEEDHTTYHPLNYVLAVFGTPGNGAPWAWRIDGHHLSLNFTHLGQEVRVVPAFYGANPAHPDHGPLAGRHILGGEEDFARELMRSLPEAQRTVARIRVAAFADILTGPGREDALRTPRGLPLASMEEGQRTLALKLTEEFIATMRQDVADRERRHLHDAGVEKLHFAWAGELEPRRPHYWRLHGPTMILEYDNTQNEANHIHSVWHDPTREFGRDLLARHYEAGHASS